MKKLSDKERFFVMEYFKSLNATKAAIRAGYSKKTARQQGARLLTKVNVQAALKEARKKIEDKGLMEAEEVERRLDAIIRFNLKDFVDSEGNLKPIDELTEEQAACISEYTVIETPLGIQRKVKFFNKLDAIKAKMQRLGMFKDVDLGRGIQVTVNIERAA